MPNPASENCTEKGGTLSIEKRGDGGEYGVCIFEDNMQCEEWALMRGECPVGGVTIKPPYYKDLNPAPIIDTAGSRRGTPAILRTATTAPRIRPAANPPPG